MKKQSATAIRRPYKPRPRLDPEIEAIKAKIVRALGGPWIDATKEQPPHGNLVLALWMPTHSAASSQCAWVIARWVAGKTSWEIVERPELGRPNLGTPATSITWWRELPELPEGIEIVHA